MVNYIASFTMFICVSQSIGNSVWFVKTAGAQHTFRIFWPLGNPVIVVFSVQRLLQNAAGVTLDEKLFKKHNQLSMLILLITW